MKKILCFGLLIIMTLILSSCGTKDSPNDAQSKQEPVSKQYYKELAEYYAFTGFDSNVAKVFVNDVFQYRADGNKEIIIKAENSLELVKKKLADVANCKIPDGVGLKDKHERFISSSKYYETTAEHVVEIMKDNGNLLEWRQGIDAMFTAREDLRRSAMDILNQLNLVNDKQWEKGSTNN